MFKIVCNYVAPFVGISVFLEKQCMSQLCALSAFE